MGVATEGALDLDCRPFLATGIDITSGDGSYVPWLPDRTDSTIHLSGGEIVDHVPDGIGVRILGAADGRIAAIGNYVETDDGLESAGCDRAPPTRRL